MVDADATVIFTMGRLTRGSLRTAEFVRAHRRPYLHVDLGHMTAARAVREVVGWRRNEAGIDYDDYLAVVPADCTLNVARSLPQSLGHRFRSSLFPCVATNGTLKHQTR